MSIIIITGTPGAGKTTVAEALCSRFQRSAHIQVDFFRKMIKAGYASPHHWNDEVAEQYALARRNAASTARNIAGAGFTVILDDIVHQEWVRDWKTYLTGFDLVLVLLQPHINSAKARNEAREIWTVDDTIIEDLHKSFAEKNTSEAGWTVIDNTAQTVDETTDEIMSRIGKLHGL